MPWLYGRRLRMLAVLVAVALAVGFCQRRDKVVAADFVGRWESSKTRLPIELYANGEWEIRGESGSVLQYGVWRYEDRKLIWSFKRKATVSDDPNPLLSMTPDEFRIRETDGSTTVFKRLP